MPNYLEIAKLRSHNLSQRSIASSLNLSRNTVSNVFTIMDQNHIDYEGLLQMSPQQIHEMFASKKEAPVVYAQPDYPSLAKQLEQPGMTMRLLWEEYTDQCLLSHLVPYKHTQFEEHLSRSICTTITMHRSSSIKLERDVNWTG